LLEALRKHPDANIPDILNQTFHNVDSNLSRLTEESDGKMHSGCTAVTAFLRLEDANGKQSFLPPGLDILQSSTEMIENQIDAAGSGDDETSSLDLQQSERGGRSKKKTSSTSKLKNALRHMRGTSRSGTGSESIHRSASLPPSPSSSTHKIEDRAFTPAAVDNIRRVLYCANAGDARGVLCRGGKAVRLTYDHKGSDKQEAKRIMDAGGFVMSGRVNGVLAVTRALGDSSMKEFVVGAPYTTETELCEEDEFLILACDGLWDVVDDQPAVDLVRGVADSRKAAEELLDHAFSNYSSDNVTVMVIRFRNPPANVKTR